MTNTHRKHRLAAIAALAVVLCGCLVAPAASGDAEAATSTSALILDGNYPDGTSETASYTMIAGSEVDLPAQVFMFDGYALTGWGTSASGGTVYDWSTAYTVPSGTETLYAQWTELPSSNYWDVTGEVESSAYVDEVYTVSVTLDSGTDAWGYLMELCSASGSSASAVSRADADTADWLGLEAEGWTLTWSGSPAHAGNYIVCYSAGSYDAGVCWVVSVASSMDSAYTIEYDLDGGSGTTPASQTVAYGAAVTLSSAFVNGTEITKSGYTLAGWSIENDLGAESTYALGSVYGTGSGTAGATVTATAVWVADSAVIVFSLDGGSLENVSAYVVDVGELYALPDGNDVSKTGYTLVGWTEAGDPQAVYAPGFVLEVDGTYLLEAVWVADGDLSSLCVVTYDYGDGTGAVAWQYVEAGGYVYLPMEGASLSGYEFLGWSAEEGGDVITTSSYQISASATLYAVWAADEDAATYTVSFDTNGADVSVASQTVYSGGLASQPAGVTKEGYVLTGWYSDDLVRNWDFDSDAVTSDTVLRAQWAPVFSYSVDGLTVTVTIYYPYAIYAEVDWGDGSSTTLIATTSASHEYEGVNVADEITVTSTVGGSTYTASRTLSGLDGDHVAVSITCEVTFDTNGGSPDSWTETVTYLDVLEEPDNPERDGYTFLGWYVNGELWDFDSYVTDDMTLTAYWESSDGEIDTGGDSADGGSDDDSSDSGDGSGDNGDAALGIAEALAEYALPIMIVVCLIAGLIVARFL